MEPLIMENIHILGVIYILVILANFMKRAIRYILLVLLLTIVLHIILVASLYYMIMPEKHTYHLGDTTLTVEKWIDFAFQDETPRYFFIQHKNTIDTITISENIYAGIEKTKNQITILVDTTKAIQFYDTVGTKNLYSNIEIKYIERNDNN